MVSAELKIEDKLWAAADKLRGSMDASEYKNVVLGLIFLKYVSDSFEEKYEELTKDEYADPEDKDEYLADNIFWVPAEARWEKINRDAKTPKIGETIDEAMIAIEKENPSLKLVLPKNYSRPQLDKTRLGETVDLITNIKVGDSENRKTDTLGRTYEYFLGKFAGAEGKSGGEFYTPNPVVTLLVEMLEPYSGRIYDPCCGAGGMFVQSEKFVENHQGKIGDISVYGQEFNPTTWQLCKMNLAIRGIDGNIGTHNADTFQNDLHKGLRADYILANPPFNISDWGQEKLLEDSRWKYGLPPKNNANYAWIQHIISKLAPEGTAGFVLANGSMSTSTKNEYEIRKNLIENDLVECIVTLPSQMFYNTQIPACLWFVTKSKAKKNERNHQGEILFIDARNEGYMADRTTKTFSKNDIKKIADTYHDWKGTNDKEYVDVAGFCSSASLDTVKEQDYILTPGRYVGLEDEIEDSELFEEKMERLTTLLSEQFIQSHQLEEDIRKALGGIGYEI
ncbi:type I restriction-modification system subunit M [Enterococcus faecalis]|uniref:class I SAM-dependent DNA methyltransferase n=1 Tax=Enterococcus faecalis TaxID=1351 RepID=UPI0015720562|nr:class I SAM-dependent DNA methyltransferase [Enterococcus faecalis]MCO5409450.1 type I restriction-modification system subunit M [Enterococcus faecalis]MCV3152858.1 type I restriction-modification system subunit M [Enterococcus faecalis]NSU59957.1 SAM-dependent DNA methyltransferase [Enterococcus faecalis]NSU78215.1 SAM-dependent DNA methyltransferase [Enterococcus faecalis]NSU98459.1 SAM-dependent DNA methyltransferase [Enterococcus faecalis]